MRSESCDIFCNVVDNYGDIGVCWRLARQLSSEHGLEVRLWVDDLRSFGKMCPELDASLSEQRCRGVEVRHWFDKDSPFALRYRRVSGDEAVGLRYLSPNGDEKGIEPADLVIEAFACKLPQVYIEAMAAREPKPVWINLEYLSAEDWVEGCHKLPSPHPSLPLTKYYFFPGFTEKTGGLLLERYLLARRDAFQSDAGAQERYWRTLGVPERVAGELRVSMFSYENEAMEALLGAWEQGNQPVTCLLPEGRSLPQVAAFFGQCVENEKLDAVRAEPVEAAKIPRSSFDRLRMNGSLAGTIWQRGQLRVHVLSFVEQERYDELLWACDVNFVRGEDSCVRAQWAARPFIWQIYPQHDGVHLAKLEALRTRYTTGLPQETAHAVRDLWLAWNGGQDIAGAWAHFAGQREVLTRHGVEWARRLAGNNLALNLLDFYRQTTNPNIL